MVYVFIASEQHTVCKELWKDLNIYGLSGEQDEREYPSDSKQTQILYVILLHDQINASSSQTSGRT